MPDADELRQRHERLERLRNLGLRRGAEHLRGPGSGSREREREGRDQQPGAKEQGARASSFQSPASSSQSPIPHSPLPGEPVQTRFGPVWVRTVRFPLTERPDLAEWLSVTGDMLAALGRDAGLLALEPARAAFVDTETTGLAIGAGTYTFMIGVGMYEDACFVVRQFFMRHPGEERAQLHLVEEALGRCTGLVTFNGRAFDLPLIHNRFILARMPLPLVAAPHLDLLPAARRVWRGSLDSCRLGSLEQNVLGVQRTEEEVPGYLIPKIYQDYYHSGVVSDLLVRVFYHNLTDITSMPLLAVRLARLFRTDGLEDALEGLGGRECINLAHCYKALQWSEAGIAALRAALQRPLADEDRVHALDSLGTLLKRLERREEAAALWEEWISSVAGEHLTPYIELAKHHEWHTGDLAAARGWAAWALRIAERLPPGPARDEAIGELRHRLARLERKLGAP